MNKKLLILITAILCSLTHTIAHAAWFEATGQAVIQNGNKQIARQQATQEALKQALLFAGASVSSVQQMANGLLTQDNFEVRASGEVNSIELIDEVYQGDVISVSIRADIFAQSSTCQPSTYKKSMATTWYPIKNRQQAAVGNLYQLGETLANRIQHYSSKYNRYSIIDQVEPYFLSYTDANAQRLSFELTTKTNSQFALVGEIVELGIESPPPQNALLFWKDKIPNRQFGLNLRVFDGTSGEAVLNETVSISAPWEFDLHQTINPNSQDFWQSAFGQAVQKLLEDQSQKIDQAISCIPAYGKVLSVNNHQLTINIGKKHGVKMGDALTLFQLNHQYDPAQRTYKQYQLHPEKVIVKQVFSNTALVVAENDAPLANIQPNDFVARR